MLENNKSFFRRHIGNSIEEQKKMLNALGFKDIKEQISKLYQKISILKIL